MAIPGTGQVVLFGGLDGAGYLSDTWTYAGGTWTENQVTGPVPAPRCGHAMFWDDVSGRIILFGGFGDAGMLNDTWTLGATGWSELLQTTPKPSPRGVATTGRMPQLSGTLLLGGQVGGSPNLEDFWRWDGAEWELLANTTPIGTRSQASMAYDPILEMLVLVGGHSASGAFHNDTWGFDGSQWSLLSVGIPGSPRSAHSMAFIPNEGKLILFGGYNNVTFFGGTWALEATGWQQLTVNEPTPRHGMNLAVDETRGTGILFGGRTNFGEFAGDTWTIGESPVPFPTSLGAGCDWGGGVVSLAPDRPAWFGEIYTLRAGNLPPASPIPPQLAIQLGAPGVPPFDLGGFGAPGCAVVLNLSSPISFLTPTFVSGFAVWNSLLPSTAAGLTFSAQALAFAPGANPRGIVLSNGLLTTIN